MFEQVRAISDWQSLNIYEMIMNRSVKAYCFNWSSRHIGKFYHKKSLYPFSPLCQNEVTIDKKIFYIVINSFQPQKLLGPYCHTVSRQSSFEIIWKVMFILSFKNTPLK